MKLTFVEAKAKEIFAKKKYLQISLKDTLHSKKALEGKVLYLRDELVSISSVYFERAK